ncbi:unnamed protein product, partial [Ectocarpus fasciculatus]
PQTPNKGARQPSLIMSMKGPSASSCATDVRSDRGLDEAQFQGAFHLESPSAKKVSEKHARTLPCTWVTLQQ